MGMGEVSGIRLRLVAPRIGPPKLSLILVFVCTTQHTGSRTGGPYPTKEKRVKKRLPSLGSRSLGRSHRAEVHECLA